MTDPEPFWDSAKVLAASNAWVWIPEGSDVVHTELYQFVVRPDHFDMPPSVRFLAPAAAIPAGALVDEVLATAAARGLARLEFGVSDDTSAGIEAELTNRGGTLVEQADVLGFDMTSAPPNLPVPADVTVRPVTDEPSLRDSLAVSHDAFGQGPPTQEHVDWALRELREGTPEGPVGRVVAYVDGRPAGTGGYTVAGSVCRLWGGSTHTSLRGRGAYRAVLQSRLLLAREQGATLGLTHGRVDSSSPILRRNGFVRYGENRRIELAVRR